MEDKKKTIDKIYIYLASLLVIVDYVSLWFIQVEVFLWICLSIAVIGLLGALIKVSRNTYIKTILSIKVLNLIGILFIVKKSIKYILVSENVLNLLGDNRLKEFLVDVKNIGGFLLILMLVLILLILSTLMIACYNIVYMVKLCKDERISKGKCIVGCIGLVLPIINWIILILCFEKFERDKHNE